jgi:hypothetical protein
LKVAILGLKGHINTVLSGAAALGDVEIVAISDDNLQAVESLISGNPLLRAAQPWQNWRHLFEHTMMDVCCVADETGIRSEQLLAIFERDVHVVSEKPLTTSLVDLERLRTAYSDSKNQLTMLLELRHQPKNVRVRELIQSGAIGEVCQVSTQDRIGGEIGRNGCGLGLDLEAPYPISEFILWTRYAGLRDWISFASPPFMESPVCIGLRRSLRAGQRIVRAPMNFQRKPMPPFWHSCRMVHQ